jgi:hypothetical protein
MGWLAETFLSGFLFLFYVEESVDADRGLSKRNLGCHGTQVQKPG